MNSVGNRFNGITKKALLLKQKLIKQEKIICNFLLPECLNCQIKFGEKMDDFNYVMHCCIANLKMGGFNLFEMCICVPHEM